MQIPGQIPFYNWGDLYDLLGLYCFDAFNDWLVWPLEYKTFLRREFHVMIFQILKKKHGEKQNEKESWKTSVSEKDRTKLAVVEKWKFPRNHRYLWNLHQELEISGFHHFFGVISLKFPNSWPLIMIRSWHLRNSKVFTWMTLNVIRMTMAVASWDLKTCLFGLFFKQTVRLFEGILRYAGSQRCLLS